jgi:hypothetical protein
MDEQTKEGRVKRNNLQRYRSMIRDGADPDPFATELAHGNDQKVVLRTPSCEFGGQFRDRYPTMTWAEAFKHMRVCTDRPPFFDSDEAFAGFHRNR